MQAIRFRENPVIRPEMLEGDDGANINGPSLIRVPDWMVKPLGRYYLYFAHHGGKYIRLAYADELPGPWKIHRPGTLHLDDAPCERHVASPDVHILEDPREIRMYYHGCRCADDGETVKQFTFVATAQDGINFTTRGDILGDFYFRVFRYGDWYYCCCKGGVFCRSTDGLTPFEAGPVLPVPGAGDVRVRHTALQLRGDTLRVFFSCIGDCPERILLSEVGLADDWGDWSFSAPRTVLFPEMDYEGVDAPHEPSSEGRVMGEAWQVRDPGIYEEDGRTYLLYSVAGESGIAIAELLE
jgi:hypothetical protein